MKKLLYGILALVFIAGGWYLFVERDSSLKLATDLYPLYPSLTWGPVQEKSVTDGPAVSVVAEPITGITNLSEYFLPFEKYYDEKLTNEGWLRDDSRAAGGPGAEVTYYTKGDKFIIVSFSTVFHDQKTDAPAQCPCDIRFTLTSGTQVGPTPAQVQATHEYHDTALGFSVTLPTSVADSKSDTEYSVDTAYEYTAQGPGKSIQGVKFTIPSSFAEGTNLSSDSYISVEHLASGENCSASVFLSDPNAVSHSLTEGILSYSVASSIEAAVGNRYEETVYARKDSSPCIAVRYFIHYGAIQNYPEGQVKEFDKQAILRQFDLIRRTLRIEQ